MLDVDVVSVREAAVDNDDDDCVVVEPMTFAIDVDVEVVAVAGLLNDLCSLAKR